MLFVVWYDFLDIFIIWREIPYVKYLISKIFMISISYLWGVEMQIFPMTEKEAKKAGVPYSKEENKNAIFPTRLRELRNSRGFSQATLAKLLEVTKSTISLYENGENVPDIKTLKKMADLFRVSYDYLLGINSPQKKVNSKIMEATGLTEKAVETLEYCIQRDRQNSITLTINALLENRLVLGAIAHYLYYEIDDEQMDNLNHNKRIILFCEKYKYLKSNPAAGWGDDVKTPIDFEVEMNAFTTEKYKKLQMATIQDELEKLLKKEGETKHFKD